MKYAIVALLLATAAAEDKPAKDPKPAAETPATCAITKLEVFTDKDCKKAPETALTADELKALKETMTKAAGKCVKETMSKVVCNKDGITTSIYKKDDCTGDVDKETAVKWGKCSEAGGKYVMATGAKALIASAAIALAFVGSQF